jgi:putative transposase
MITEAIRPGLYGFLKNKIVETPGAYFHAIGGIETHIHLAFSVQPSVHLDEYIGQLKGASSFEMGKGLQWQAGYGIVSFGTRDLEWVVRYIHSQREHHQNGTGRERLERFQGAGDEATVSP